MPKKDTPHRSSFTVRSQLEERYIDLSCISQRTRQQEKQLVGLVRFARMVKAAEEILAAEARAKK